MRKCQTCNVSKPPKAFSSRTQNRCRDCRRAYYLANAEHAKAAARAYRRAHPLTPEQKARQCEWTKSYYARNRKRILRRLAERRRTDPEFRERYNRVQRESRRRTRARRKGGGA